MTTNATTPSRLAVVEADLEQALDELRDLNLHLDNCKKYISTLRKEIMDLSMVEIECAREAVVR
jgi:hypothetical protein